MAITVTIEAIQESIEEIIPRNVVLSYDADSDILVVHFFGRGIPGISVPFDTSGDWMVRVDPETHRPIGFHLENFLHSIVPQHPNLRNVLTVAQLRGTTKGEIDENDLRKTEETPLLAMREIATEFRTVYATAAD